MMDLKQVCHSVASILSGRLAKALLIVAVATLIFVGDVGQSRSDQDRLVADIEPTMLSANVIDFIPGVFRLDDANDKMEMLCIPSNGVWKLPGGEVCPLLPGNDQPLASQRYQMGPQLPSGVRWVVANLGINSQQWAKASSSTGQLSKIAASIRLQRLTTKPAMIQYRFNSVALPEPVTAQVPGSGIYVHMQDILPRHPEVFPFSDQRSALQLEARLALPAYKNSGGATDGITIGLSFQAPNDSHQLAPLFLLVSLFNSKGLYRERIGTDGRNVYAASDLSDASSFLTPKTTFQLKPNQAPQTFAFRITAKNMSALLAAINVYEQSRGQAAFDEDLSQVRLRQIDLRNESGNLKYGTLFLDLRVAFVRAFITTD